MSKRSLKEMTQGMSFAEKLEYLWEYYRWILLVLAFGVIVIAMVVTGIVNTSGEVFYSGAMVNVQLSQEGESFLTERLEENFNAPKREKAKLFATSFQDLQNVSDVEMSAAAAYRVVLMIIAKDYDYVIMDETAWNYYKNHPVFTALDEMFSDEIMEQYSDRIIRHQLEESAQLSLAIDITDSAFARKYAQEGTKLYIAFPGNTGRTEMNDDFLEYLMNAE